ncbi:hypothetical protein Avbf_10070, partial [Armadillidium vulgare]
MEVILQLLIERTKDKESILNTIRNSIEKLKKLFLNGKIRRIKTQTQKNNEQRNPPLPPPKKKLFDIAYSNATEMIKDEEVWSHKQTLLLLVSLKKQKELYVCSHTRNQAFTNIHKKFIEHNHPFSIDDIKRKWRNITRTYRTTRDKCRHTGEGKQTWPYYEMVHEICEYKGSGEITASELALMDTFLEEEKSTATSDIETHRVKQFPTSTLSCKRKVLKPCSEVCFKEYALESSKLLKTISENMDKINDSMSGVKKSLDENTLTMNRLMFNDGEI